jgi:hypothetical protein
MREAQPARQPYTVANVPLRREHLRQPALLDPWYPNTVKTYPLPLVVPGEEAKVVDSDYHWQKYNGRRGVVTGYSYFYGDHTILFNNGDVGNFQAREIMKGETGVSTSRRMLSIMRPLVYDDGDGRPVIDESL